MNIKLLRRIQKQILKEPRQFQMKRWFHNYASYTIPNCGTAACIGGWASALSKNKNPAQVKNSGFCPEKTLALIDKQPAILFLFENWPAQFRKHTKEGTPAFARQAVKRIDHFIKTKGAE